MIAEHADAGRLASKPLIVSTYSRLTKILPGGIVNHVGGNPGTYTPPLPFRRRLILPCNVDGIPSPGSSDPSVPGEQRHLGDQFHLSKELVLTDRWDSDPRDDKLTTCHESRNARPERNASGTCSW